MKFTLTREQGVAVGKATLDRIAYQREAECRAILTERRRADPTIDTAAEMRSLMAQYYPGETERIAQLLASGLYSSVELSQSDFESATFAMREGGQ